jgi:hypothetical protein
MANDIKFVKTNKEWKDIQDVIEKEHLNSFIHVNSQSENNIYIGTDRVTDNYNSRVEDGSITNNVGGMTSGIDVVELRNKSISEILDIILFASNNNLTLKGVQVVDKVENLTDSTLMEVYQGMVVSVLEDNSLYILLSESGVEREWKKVGSDINIEELKTSTKKLSSPITVAGLSGSIGNVSNGKIYTTDNTVEDILRDLLCKEIYPSVSLSTTKPTITFNGINEEVVSDYKSVMKVGSVLTLNSVTLSEASISDCYRIGSGFTYGYSKDNDNKKDGSENPPKQDGTSSLTGKYSLTETYEPSSIGTVRTVNSSENYEDVKFDSGSVIIGLGSNEISLTAKSPSGSYTHPEYPEYYVVSNLGNTNVNKKLSKSNVVNGTLNSIESISNISVTGVYPVYVNIDSGKFVNETIEMDPTTSNEFVFNVPSEVKYKIHFNFDYPSTHSLESFKILGVGGITFEDYKSTYEIKELEDKIVADVKYNRLAITGDYTQGEGTYKITLSKRLDKK